MFHFGKKTLRGRCTFPIWQLEKLPRSASSNHLSALCKQGWVSGRLHPPPRSPPRVLASVTQLQGLDSTQTSAGSISWGTLLLPQHTTQLEKTEYAMRTRTKEPLLSGLQTGIFFPLGKETIGIKWGGWLMVGMFADWDPNSPEHVGWQVTSPGQSSFLPGASIISVHDTVSRV